MRECIACMLQGQEGNSSGKKLDSKVKNDIPMTILFVWKLKQSSKNISYFCSVIADLPTKCRQFRLITPGDGCICALPTGGWTCDMIAKRVALPEAMKVFFNLQLRDFLQWKPCHSAHYGAQVGSANKSLSNSACDASRSAISACRLRFIAGGTCREERRAMVKLSYEQLFCIPVKFKININLLLRMWALEKTIARVINLASKGNANTVETCLWIDDFTPGYRLLLLLGHTFD